MHRNSAAKSLYNEINTPAPPAPSLLTVAEQMKENHYELRILL